MRGKLRVLIFTGVTASASGQLVTLSATHVPNSATFCNAVANISGKIYLAYVNTGVSATGSLTIAGNYLASYAAGGTPLNTSTAVYGDMVWFTA